MNLPPDGRARYVEPHVLEQELAESLERLRAHPELWLSVTWLHPLSDDLGPRVGDGRANSLAVLGCIPSGLEPGHRLFVFHTVIEHLSELLGVAMVGQVWPVEEDRPEPPGGWDE